MTGKRLITSALIFTLFLFGVCEAQLRVEPAFWWVNMENPKLQVLVHAKDIGTTVPQFSYAGVTLDSVVKPTSKNYLFLYLSVKPGAMPGKFDIQFMQKGKAIAKYAYELKDRRPGSAERSTYNTSDVIYLLMPDRFSNGNPANDQAPDMIEKLDRANPGGRHGGDIQGIINHLDYLKDLGFTAIWSTPLMEDNMDSYSYHTYAITDYYRIDPRYGNNQDYVRLSDEMHTRGMKLIMDVVTNHCGSNHWWMKDLPMQDWLHQFKEFTRTNYQISTTYDPYASDYDKNLNFDGWFDSTMPDLNQDNPHLLTYLTQNTIWWIEYANLDGIRIDTYPYNNPWKIAQWSKGVRTEYPNLNIVGECWVHSPQEISYWQSGTKNHDGYDSQLPVVMDFALHDVFLQAVNEEDSWGSGTRRFYNHFTLDYVYTRPQDLLIFTENHDTPRFYEVIKGDMRKFKIAYAILFTVRGIPQFYYGSEINMPGSKDKGDGDIRRDFPGGWPGDVRNAFTAQGRTAQENEAFNYIKKLLNWRKANPVIHTGKTKQFISQDNCYVYFRYNNEKTVMVAINNHDIEQRTLDGSRFNEMLSGFKSGKDIISGTTISDLSRITIPAKTAMIIELEK
ncbi:MAG TPA: glycoside hydrolase family 13 protein [Bacteroidales bacterium]|nr:glycoside hydrolase family 13 protein [Bacteroidales bacterium]